MEQCRCLYSWLHDCFNVALLSPVLVIPWERLLLSAALIICPARDHIMFGICSYIPAPEVLCGCSDSCLKLPLLFPSVLFHRHKRMWAKSMLLADHAWKHATERREKAEKALGSSSRSRGTGPVQEASLAAVVQAAHPHLCSLYLRPAAARSSGGGGGGGGSSMEEKQAAQSQQ